MQPPPLTTTPPPPPPPPPPPQPPYVKSSGTLTDPKQPDPKRWQAHPTNPDAPAPELTEDVLLAMLEQVDAVAKLQECKLVCKAWRRGCRQVLCDARWLVCQGVSLHELLKSGLPSTPLAVKLVQLARSRSGGVEELLNERDAKGLLPLQYAAAYRKFHPELVDQLRTLTRQGGAGLPVLSQSAFALRRGKLRAVQTRRSHTPIPDTQAIAF